MLLIIGRLRRVGRGDALTRVGVVGTALLLLLWCWRPGSMVAVGLGWSHAAWLDRHDGLCFAPTADTPLASGGRKLILMGKGTLVVAVAGMWRRAVRARHAVACAACAAIVVISCVAVAVAVIVIANPVRSRLLSRELAHGVLRRHSRCAEGLHGCRFCGLAGVVVVLS